MRIGILNGGSPLSTQFFGKVANCAHEPHYVACLVAPRTWIPFFVADHLWRVVVDHEAVVANLLERAHDAGDVERTLADEALVEPVALALDRAEVDVDDLVARSEVADAAQDVLGATHLGPTADAEEQPPGGAFAEELPG